MDKNLYERCVSLLDKYQLSKLESDALKQQLENVCNELAANQIEESETAIVQELFNVNEIMPELKDGLSKPDMVVVNNMASEFIKLANEQYSLIHIENKWGLTEIDLTKFNFTEQLDIKLANFYGQVVIYINQDTKYTQRLKNTASSIETKEYFPNDNAQNVVFLNGENSWSSITIITCSESLPYRKRYNKKQYKEEVKKAKLRSKLNKN